MTFDNYKKMAGTAAVFVRADLDRPSPVERDGMVWTARELHLEELTDNRTLKESMATVLALEGLEDYDPPRDGDMRKVEALDACFVFHKRVQAWLQLA